MNNINYDLICKKILQENTNKKILLHACCAPCATYPLELLANYLDVTVFFYNPNINSLSEYQTRLGEFEKFKNLKIVDAKYTPNEYLQLTGGLETAKEGGERCVKCYDLRLDKTAKYAKDNGFDLFGTTLTVSPYKNCSQINRLGIEAENKFNVKFLLSDFKKSGGYQRSILLSRALNLYRQNYCGCAFSLR